MLLIDHYVGKSTIYGLGVFSAEFIPKGQKVWEFHSAINRIVSRADLEDLPRYVRSLIEARSEYIMEERAFLTSLDGDQFVNHSDNPNTYKSGEEWFAATDIHPGDEVTCDYRQTLVLGYDPETGKPHNSPRPPVR